MWQPYLLNMYPLKVFLLNVTLWFEVEYVDRIAQWRGSDQLFVCFGAKNKGTAITKQRMSHWIVEAISMAYEVHGLTSPLEVRAHLTRAMASSQALFKGQSILQPSASVHRPH